jgi:hypothetical protein
VETLKDKYFRPQGLVREIAGGQEGRQKKVNGRRLWEPMRVPLLRKPEGGTKARRNKALVFISSHDITSRTRCLLIIRLLKESTIDCAKLGSTPLVVAVC